MTFFGFYCSCITFPDGLCWPLRDTEKNKPTTGKKKSNKNIGKDEIVLF